MAKIPEEPNTHSESCLTNAFHFNSSGLLAARQDEFMVAALLKEHVLELLGVLTGGNVIDNRSSLANCGLRPPPPQAKTDHSRMNLKDAIQNFDPSCLRHTLVETRNPDGSVTVTDKYGLPKDHETTEPRPEPNFSTYGFIVNPNPDMQVGDVDVDGYHILFGSLDVAKDRECLKSHGVTHVINLISNYAPNYFPNDFQYLSLILYDDYEFRLRDSIYQCSDYLKMIKRENGRCFIHCDAGRSRSPSMVIGYLITVEEYSYERAYNVVNNARNVSINFNFRSQLMAMA
ncbi:unnamed protein product [Calicophoron daubneyi]|uniref:Uncharacterized protein n=1 Tax=Calicophoron daubneyi TaxID=300641 RepID=A0AAV2TB20_CALDB